MLQFSLSVRLIVIMPVYEALLLIFMYHTATLPLTQLRSGLDSSSQLPASNTRQQDLTPSLLDTNSLSYPVPGGGDGGGEEEKGGREVSEVVEESGPVEYSEEEEEEEEEKEEGGLGDADVDELAYEGDPLLYSDGEDGKSIIQCCWSTHNFCLLYLCECASV